MSKHRTGRSWTGGLTVTEFLLLPVATATQLSGNCTVAEIIKDATGRLQCDMDANQMIDQTESQTTMQEKHGAPIS